MSGMTFQAEWYQVLALASGLVGAFWALASVLVRQNQRHIDKQFETIVSTLKSQDEGTRRIERDLMELKAELPRDYVRREDHNRVIGGVQLSIDNLSLKIERAMLQRNGQ